jgi:valyl-tRNA synthetase
MPLVLVGVDADVRRRAGLWDATIKRLARASDISFADVAPPESAQMIVRGTVAALPLAGVVDIAAEKTRLVKEIAKEEGEVRKVDAKLNNADFVRRAPEEVVEENRERREEALSRIGKLKSALERLQ